MRNTYIVSYDISDPKRLRQVFRVMRGWGDRVQLSVFRCEVSPQELVEMRAQLRDAIHAGEDQVMFVDVGPADARGRAAISAMGRPYVVSEVVATVV